MNDLVSFFLDLNILVQKSNTVEKRLFNCIFESMEYYLPVRSLTPTKPIFFWIVKLSLLVMPPIDLNYIENKNYSGNDNISNKMDIGNRVNIGNKLDIGDKIDDKISWTDGLLPTNLNQTEIESCNNHYDMYNTVGEEIYFTEDIT